MHVTYTNFYVFSIVRTPMADGQDARGTDDQIINNFGHKHSTFNPRPFLIKGIIFRFGFYLTAIHTYHRFQESDNNRRRQCREFMRGCRTQLCGLHWEVMRWETEFDSVNCQRRISTNRKSSVGRSPEAGTRAFYLTECCVCVLSAVVWFYLCFFFAPFSGGCRKKRVRAYAIIENLR